jgi:hypothetical protein
MGFVVALQKKKFTIEILSLFHGIYMAWFRRAFAKNKIQVYK